MWPGCAPQRVQWYQRVGLEALPSGDDGADASAGARWRCTDTSSAETSYPSRRRKRSTWNTPTQQDDRQGVACDPITTPHLVQEEVLQHAAHIVLTSHNTPVPTTPYSPGGGATAHSALTSHSTHRYPPPHSASPPGDAMVRGCAYTRCWVCRGTVVLWDTTSYTPAPLSHCAREGKGGGARSPGSCCASATGRTHPQSERLVSRWTWSCVARRWRDSFLRTLRDGELTTTPKMDTNCTTLSLKPPVNGNGSQLLPRTDNCPQPKEARPLSHALTRSN
jgi:hypothetical protein